MKKVICMMVLVLLSITTRAQALEWTTQQLTENALWDGLPDISGDNIIWQHWDGHDYEVQLYNGIKTLDLTDNDFDDTNLDTGGSLSIWVGKNDLYVYDGKKTLFLDESVFNDFNDPVASHDNVYWINSSRWYHYDGTTVRDITETAPPPRGPEVVYADKIVGESRENIQADILYYNGTETVNLSNDPVNNDLSPYINENKITWGKVYADNAGGLFTGADIFLYDIDTAALTNLTNDPATPRGSGFVSDHVVVWFENNALVYYNVLTGKKTTTDAFMGSIGYDVKLVGDLLVGYNNHFAGYGLPHEALLAFDGETVYTLADGNTVGAIQGWDGYGNKIVWDFMPDGAASREIFAAQFIQDPRPVPEPATAFLLMTGGAMLAWRRRRQGQQA